MRCRLALTCLLLLALAAPAGAGAADGSAIAAYQPDRRVAPGTLPKGGADALVLHAPGNGYADGQVAVRGVRGELPVEWDPASHPELVARADLLEVATTRVKRKRVADPLPPLGAGLSAPGVVFLRIPTRGLGPGTYAGTLRIGELSMPVSLTVHAWSLPPREQGFRTLFLIQPQTYYKAVDPRNGFTVAQKVNGDLFEFLSDYRIAPGDWGYANPHPDRGYFEGKSWHKRKRSLMREKAEFGFNTLRLPLSTQRKAGRPLGGASPSKPETWRPWLEKIRPFWTENGWDDRAVAWTLDEPGPKGKRLLARQARALHTGFPGAKLLSTLTPEKSDRYLRNGGKDDLDIWAVLSRRFYGTYKHPRRNEKLVNQIRKRKELWSYTYRGPKGSPGFDATEPLTEPRMFFAWNALERTEGTLYAQGMNTYKGLDPWVKIPGHGQTVLVYPGTPANPEPVSSLRLEAIRDGIQDVEVFEAYAKRFGQKRLAKLLGEHDLFSVDKKGRLLLGCVRNCDVKTKTKYAFPRWQQNERKASAGLERARVAALRALAR